MRSTRTSTRNLVRFCAFFVVFIVNDLQISML